MAVGAGSRGPIFGVIIWGRNIFGSTVCDDKNLNRTVYMINVSSYWRLPVLCCPSLPVLSLSQHSIFSKRAD